MSEKKTNRFNKSIIDAENNTQSKSNVEAEEPLKQVDNIEQNIEVQKVIKHEISDISNTILEKIFSEDVKNKGGNHTLYLSYEVGTELNNISRKLKKVNQK